MEVVNECNFVSTFEG